MSKRSGMSEIRCSIQLAAKKSGVTPHLIRIWERRYEAVSPNRSDTNRRLYSEAEIERLKLLRTAIDAGHRIGNIAKLSDEQLRELSPRSGPGQVTTRLIRPPSGELVAASLSAVEILNEPAFEEVLDLGVLAYGGHGLLANLVVPLAHEIGVRWRDGAMTAAHEHFATAVLRTYLLKKFRPFAANGNAPRLVAATPAGQIHELGAVIVTAAAGDLGWNTAFLGAHLPAAEIASAAIQHHASVIALSIVYPADDPELPAELLALRRHLPESISILAGGRAANAYAETLDQIHAIRIADLKELYAVLERLRSKAG